MPDDVIPCASRVGSCTFCNGVKVKTVQGAIDRLHKAYMDATEDEREEMARRFRAAMQELEEQ